MIEFHPVPSKLLLFGEYSILSGSAAITIPLWDFKARLFLPSRETEVNRESNHHIRNFIRFLKQDDYFTEHIDTDELAKIADRGLFLQSNIPEGYGLGSSAALCVALYKAFGRSALTETKSLIALYSKMEAYFHGNSSGIDPITIHTGNKLLIRNGVVKTISNTPNLFNGIYLYLLDSNLPRHAKSFIETYRYLSANSHYVSHFKLNYLPLVDRIVQSAETGNTAWNDLMELSQQQLFFFRKMMPDPIYALWEGQLETRNVCLKLLGAGGGGYFLVFSLKELNHLEDYNLIRICA